MITRKNKNSKAFTLLELLTVVAVIAILAALLLPALNKAKMSGHVEAIRYQTFVDNHTNTWAANHSIAPDHALCPMPLAVVTP